MFFQREEEEEMQLRKKEEREKEEEEGEKSYCNTSIMTPWLAWLGLAGSLDFFIWLYGNERCSVHGKGQLSMGGTERKRKRKERRSCNKPGQIYNPIFCKKEKEACY